MSRSYQRPENALKRASEFIGVEKPNRALEVLYEVIKRGKMRSSYSEKLLEPIMFKYLELCVDLKKSHLAKEGLYQYRNIVQSVNVSSLETVVRRYLSLAEERTDHARRESHQAVVDIDDLENLANPEEILLSAVSGEDAQDRSDRTILTPWVKFLWESYRQCLELLRTNSRVERLYHDIAKQAFKFCEKYSRKTEFRKLCDNLRTHLSHIQKQQGSATAVNLNNPETQQMNLETRLEQLNYAIKMELWQEAYKAIEDISDLMNKSKKMPKPHVMASYYQKLSMVFWKAGNQLFHAAALFKLFQLLRDQKKNITSDELGKRASIVLIATLAIPLPSAHPEFDRFIETEKSALEKIEKLATLLSLPKPPTRVSLIRDLIRYNVVSAVPPELQSLYQLMEVEFDPLHVCGRMQNKIEWIQEHPELGLTQYVPALQEMIITRLVKQVAQVYQSITFKRLLELCVFIDGFHLERILVDLVRHNDLQIRVDHRSDCIHFGVDLSESQREDLPEGPMLQSLPSETIRCQLVEMSSSVQHCLALIVPESKKNEMEPMRAQTIQYYQQTKQREHRKILQRQHIIEERKEMLENQNLEREESIRRAQEEQLKRQKEAEQQRLEQEASRREKARQEEQLKQIHTKQIKDRLIQISQTSYGQKMMEKFDEEELLNLGAEEILQRQVEELEKERKELNHRLKAQEKKVDYLERAKRLVEIPLLKDLFEKEKDKDREFWETQEEERVTKLVEEHQLSLQHCKRLSCMQVDRTSFLNQLKSTRRSDIEKKLNDFNARLEVERKNRLSERKEQRYRQREFNDFDQSEFTDYDQSYDQSELADYDQSEFTDFDLGPQPTPNIENGRRERRETYYRTKAEEEQQRRDEEVKKAREDAEREEKEAREREEREYMERKAALDRQAELQRERERAIEEKAKMERSSAAVPLRRKPDDAGAWRRGGGDDNKEESPAPAEQNSTQGERPSGAWRPGGGTWREKEREKLDAWRKKDEDADADEEGGGEEEEEEEREPRDKGNRDIRKDEPPRDRGTRDIRREDPPADSGERRGFGASRDDRFGGGREDRFGGGRDRDDRFGARDRDDRFGSSNDSGGGGGGGGGWRRGPERSDRGGGGGDRDFGRGGGDRDFGRGGGDRDFGRGGGDRDFTRGSDRDRDFGRGGDRDFTRGGGDRDFTRGSDRDRDFGRGGDDRFRRGGEDRDGGRGGFGRRMDDDRRAPDRGPSRSDEGGSWRSARAAPPPVTERRDDREEKREPERREPMRNVERRGGGGGEGAGAGAGAGAGGGGGGGGGWRTRDVGKPKEEPQREEKPRPPPSEEEADGWKTVAKR